MSDKNVDFMRKTDGEEVGNSTLPTQQNKNSPLVPEPEFYISLPQSDGEELQPDQDPK